MKLAIIGSRSFDNYPLLQETLIRYQPTEDPDRWEVNEVISGGARGADSLGAKWAREHGVKLTEYLPDWEKHGKRAGFMRNEDIVRAADMVVCFWDGISRGSANSLNIAKRLKKPTLIVYC